ncbi:MAG: hypothetical protein WCF40_16185 [Desulfobacterales bacterium]
MIRTFWVGSTDIETKAGLDLLQNIYAAYPPYGSLTTCEAVATLKPYIG